MRFLRPALAATIAASTFDWDGGREGFAGANGTASSAGGLAGFGLFGSVACKASPSVGTALSFYHFAGRAYTAIVSNGPEVIMGRINPLDIRFGERREVLRAISLQTQRLSPKSNGLQ